MSVINLPHFNKPAISNKDAEHLPRVIVDEAQRQRQRYRKTSEPGVYVDELGRKYIQVVGGCGLVYVPLGKSKA